MIERRKGNGNRTTDGSGGDEHTLSPLTEIGNELFRDPDNSQQIGVELARDLLFRSSLQRSHQTVSGIVKNHVYLSQCKGFLHRSFYLRAVGNVQGQERQIVQLRQFGF